VLQSNKTRLVKPQELVVGMQLASDLRTHDGVLLLTRDCLINAQNIAQIRRFEQLQSVPLQITIHM
jgi:hypothetical protein